MILPCVNFTEISERDICSSIWDAVNQRRKLGLSNRCTLAVDCVEPPEKVAEIDTASRSQWGRGESTKRTASAVDCERYDAITSCAKQCLVRSNDQIHADSIVGLDEVKRIITDSLVSPLRFPKLFKSALTRPPRGLLLYGPPGTGKTMIAKWIASECKASFFNVRASAVFSKYLGESEKLVRAIFEEAEENAPSVIFLDEVDGILSARQGNDHESTRRVKNELLISMDGVTTSTRHQVTVIAASNMPWEIDEAALRRFEHKLYVPLPDAQTRLALIKGELQRFAEECGKPACLHSDSIENVVQSTSGYSCSDIHQVLRMAALVPTREAISAGSPEFLRGLDTSDIEFALSRSTAKLVDTDKYSKWQSSFKN